jgi:hypothetical protein
VSAQLLECTQIGKPYAVVAVIFELVFSGIFISESLGFNFREILSFQKFFRPASQKNSFNIVGKMGSSQAIQKIVNRAWSGISNFAQPKTSLYFAEGEFQIWTNQSRKLPGLEILGSGKITTDN